MTKSEWTKEFAHNLCVLLHENNISQRELADKAGLTYSMVNDYVRGRSIPSATSILNIAYALNVDLHELIDFDDVVN